jgi:hypothetical protein
MRGVSLLVVMWAYFVGLFLGVAVLLERADRPGWIWWLCALVGLVGIGLENLRLARKARLEYRKQNLCSASLPTGERCSRPKHHTALHWTRVRGFQWYWDDPVLRGGR